MVVLSPEIADFDTLMEPSADEGDNAKIAAT
jgi:hypothetical protein